MFEQLEALRQKKPLVHCITNPISINLCANGLLAIGAQPIMAKHPEEVKKSQAMPAPFCSIWETLRMSVCCP